MRIDQPMLDQSTNAGQQTRWVAYVEGNLAGGYLPKYAFTWRGFACGENEAITNAAKAAQLALRTFDALDRRPVTGAAPFATTALRVEAVPEGYPTRNDFTHGLSVVGEPFIQRGGPEEKLCFTVERSDYTPGSSEHKVASRVRREIERLLMIDPAIRRAARDGRQISISWQARVDVLYPTGGPQRPCREVGFSVCDERHVGIPLAEATANAILMLMLQARVAYSTWKQCRLFSLVWRPPVDERPGYQDAFEEERARLLCNPGRLFGETIWDLLRFGHTDLAAHAVAMADTTEPRVSAPIAQSARTSKAARTVPSLPNAATLN